MTTHAIAHGQLAPNHHVKEERGFSHSYTTPPSSTHTQSEVSQQASNPSSFDPLAHPPLYPLKKSLKQPMPIEPKVRNRTNHPYSIQNIINPSHERPYTATSDKTYSPPLTWECGVCGCPFKQVGCRYKHQWEKSIHWNYVNSLAVTKAQQVQILEAAHILVEISASQPPRPL